jgi:hypothetical protein
MPFWGKFQRKEVPQAKGLETHDSRAPGRKAGFSIQPFGLTLLQQESALTPKQNVFISPLSSFLALAMTENGAAGETKAAMRKVLGLPADASEEAVNESAAALLKSLRSHGEAELAIANALWVDVKSTIAPNLCKCASKYTLQPREHSTSTTLRLPWLSTTGYPRKPGEKFLVSWRPTGS